jgi:hypothetical protein
MEYGLLFLFSFLCGFYLFKRGYRKTHEPSITQIDDKNFIVKGELVSFEEDTDIDKLHQSQEDSRVWREYEKSRLDDERRQLERIWDIRKYFIDNPKLGEDITEEDIAANREKYLKYTHKCEVFFGLPLSEREFCVREKLHLALSCFMPSFRGQIYTIYSESTAKYKKNMAKKLEEEFNKKYKI